MSLAGIGALERGYRRTPQRETLALLAGALALDDEQRKAFEGAATRPSSPRSRSSTRVTVGPWPNAASVNVPLALTRFFGREAALQEIAALVAEHRLVTVTGPGGIGKTQTALRAATAAGSFPEATACFVNLAAIRDPSLVVTAIASALGVQEVPNHPLLETSIAFLRNKTVLLLLDNCEHVLGEVAAAADSLLRACPNLRILATSREPLRAAGERAYRLSSLADNEAVALFVDRAQAADVHFTLGSHDGPVVAEICSHLGGIPLAVELAAARVTVLSLRALVKDLDDRFGVLIVGERIAPPRQQTMRATIDWSYELLLPPEQQVFERLSIFGGGCTMNIARAVCEGGDVAAGDVLLLISSLVSKSLVLADLAGEEPRYRLLEPFREYAREKLKARGEEAAVARRHVIAYLERAASFARRDQHYAIFYGHPHDEVGNWRAAVQWALTDRNDVLAGQRLVSEVVCLWAGTTPVLSDARRWIPAALDLVDDQTPPDVIAKLKLAEAHLASHLDHHAVQLASAREAIAYYRGVGDELNLLRALGDAGNALIDLEQYDAARAVLEEALDIARRLGLRWHIADILRELACCYPSGAGLRARRAYLTEALQIFKAIDARLDIDAIAHDFAKLAFDEGDAESAVTIVTDLFARGYNRYTSRRFPVLDRLGLLNYLVSLGRYEEANTYAREALYAARDQGLEVYTAEALAWLATIATVRAPAPTPDVYKCAARIMGFVQARFRTLGTAPQDHERTLESLREAIGKEAVAELSADGASMTEDRAVELAETL